MKAGKQRDAGSSRDRINEARRVRTRSRGTPGAPLRRAAGAAVEALERRVLLSKVGAVVDAGDSYFNYTEHQQEPLYRVTDQVVVGFYPSSARRRARLEAALVAKAGPLAGYEVAQRFNDSSILLVRTARGPAPAQGVLEQSVAGFPNLKFFSPSFFRADGTRTMAYDELYVDLKDDADANFVFAKGFAGMEPAAGINAYNVTLRHGGGLDALRVAAKLRASPYVEAVEPDLTLTLTPSFAPNDPLYQISADRWNLDRVQASAAWDKTRGGKDVVIAVLDNGVQLNHPDLKDNIFQNDLDPTVNGVDEDGDGIDGDFEGYDFYSGDLDANPDPIDKDHPHPPDQHGTVVAGIAAAAALALS